MSFSFVGRVPPSKSLLNRLLVIRSFGGSAPLPLGASQATDVLLMEAGLLKLASGFGEINCGEAGTVFRFLAFRFSRVPGRWLLRASHRLLHERPQREMGELFSQLKVTHRFLPEGLELEVRDPAWKGLEVEVDASRSSQFASGLLLSSWNLPAPLRFRWAAGKDRVSDPYFEMTAALLRRAGLKLITDSNGGEVLPTPAPQDFAPQLEADLSSAFAVAALAAVGGSCRIENFPENSLQADRVFPELLQSMGVPVECGKGVLKIERAPELQALDCSLKDAPDLFPVLSLLCAFASGRSGLRDLKQLRYKESDRLERIQGLLTQLGRVSLLQGEDLLIEGRPGTREITPFNYDPRPDHRLAMAAAVAKAAGAPLTLEHLEVLDKSFPELKDLVR